MCVMCCAVPLTTLAISSGLFASLAVMVDSQGLGRGLLFIAAFSMIGIRLTASLSAIRPRTLAAHQRPKRLLSQYARLN